MMPQALAAMSLKDDHARNSRALRLPRRSDFQYRDVGLLMLLFSTIGAGTSGVAESWRRFSALDSSHLCSTPSMNTLVYADVNESQTASASTIASTMQQMSISFGVASASLVTAFSSPTGSTPAPRK